MNKLQMEAWQDPHPWWFVFSDEGFDLLLETTESNETIICMWQQVNMLKKIDF